MNKKEKPIKYILYARKSTESEDKQVQSIEDQVNKMTEMAQQKGLQIIDVLWETKSAKTPFKRDKFNELIKRVKAGEADGILTWAINRLSRNAFETGVIHQMLQDGIIKSIWTCTGEHKSGDNVLIFYMLGGMANLDIQITSISTKRGLESKIEKGWLPTIAPIGYLNNKFKDKGEKDIVKDPERFSIVRKMWDLMLTGNYTVPHILNIAYENWGLRTVKRKRIGGTKLSKSGLYKIFTNPFYAGILEWKGERYPNPGKHESMITLEEFYRVQFILGKRGKPRVTKHQHKYNGVLKCAECGCSFTGDLKRKYAKTTGKLTEYIFYKCTKKKPNYDCQNRKHIRQEKMEMQIQEALNNLSLIPDLCKWSIETLKMTNEKEFEEREDIHKSLNSAIINTQKQLDNLLQLRISELITDEEYKGKRATLQDELFRLRENLRGTEERADKYHQLVEDAFDYVTYAKVWFDKGTYEEKRSIMSTLGSNFLINIGELLVTNKNWIDLIKEKYAPVTDEYRRIELAHSDKYLTENEKRELFAPVISKLLPGVGSNHRPIGYYLTSIS